MSNVDQLRVTLNRERAKLVRQQQAVEATKTLIALIEQQLDAAVKKG